MDYKAARQAMVDTQLRPNNVRDPRVLAAFSAIPREIFISGPQKALTYSDEGVSVFVADSGEPPRKLLAPMVLARLIEAAQPDADETALDIGGGTGYSAAILAKLCASVHALEVSEAYTEVARQTLAQVGASNVTVSTGPLSNGLAENGPFDIILLNGAVMREPRHLFDQLAEGGRLVCIVGSSQYAQAYVYMRIGEVVSGRPIFDTAADVLPGFAAEPLFVF